MNFFEHQEQSKRKTALLVVLFTLAVIGIILSVYAVIVAAIQTQNTHAQFDNTFKWFDPNIFFSVTIGVFNDYHRRQSL